MLFRSLLYTKGEDSFEIYDDFQVLQTLDAPWFQDTEGHWTVWITVLAKHDNSEERVCYQSRRDELIGYDLDISEARRGVEEGNV